MGVATLEIRSTKSEIRNKSEIQMLETIKKKVLNFENLNLFRISIFEFRIFNDVDSDG